MPLGGQRRLRLLDLPVEPAQNGSNGNGLPDLPVENLWIPPGVLHPYYICFSRHRYGKQECDQDRLRGEELEEKVVEITKSTLFREDFVEEAVALSASTLNARRPRLEAELKAVETKVAKSESGLDRYFRAFEEGKLREDQCISRIQSLTLELTELKARRDELADDPNAEQPRVPDAEDIVALRREMESALQEGSLPQRKAVLQRFIEEIR